MTSVDFAIIGGGASGIYAAWRLAHANGAEVAAIRAKIGGEGPLRIQVFEMSDRIGGRLLSASPKVLPEICMELGGMRYMDDHVLVKGLVEEKFGLKTKDQTVDSPDNLAWLRNRQFRTGDLGKAETDLPFNLTDLERSYLTTPKPDGTPKSPSSLIFWSVFKSMPELAEMAPEDIRPYLETDPLVDGRPLHEIGFWNLISRHLSNEARTLAIKTVGYDCLGSNANAVDIIAENLGFRPTSKYHVFEEGFETVLWRLADEFQAAGGEIVFGEELESFDTKHFAEAPPQVDMVFQSGRGTRARNIVLALPQWALRNLRKLGPVMDPDRAPEFRRLLGAVAGVPLYKLFVIYDQAWWADHDPALQAGRSVTDLPVRQAYYWHTDPEGGASAIMAYNDEASVSYWGGYQLGALSTGEAGPGEAAHGAGPLSHGPQLFQPTPEPPTHPDPLIEKRRRNWWHNKAPAEMVYEMHRQLEEIHQIKDAPQPIDAAFVDWGTPPYGGAVHFWNPGYKSWEVRDRMVHPVPEVPAFVIGEAWSTWQTWVEGAFQTAEIFLSEMGMEHPEWVPAGE